MKDFNYFLQTIGEVGYVEDATSSLANVSGLPTVRPQEVIFFETGEQGIVGNMQEDFVEVLVFSKKPIKVGTKVARTNYLFAMPVGKEYIGNTIDPFGNLLDAAKPFTKPSEYREIDTPPGGISTRKRISKTFDTGVTLVDLLITLGRGQRELVMGDRKTGKTNFLYQSILTQAKQGTICIYAAIGKKRLDIKAAQEFFAKNNILDKIILMASYSDDPTATIYLTPYCAMTLSEYLRDQGHDVLLVLDDMFTHAKFYREIALLGRRFPGRNSYPADIFYTHARLLERAGNFITPNGEKSITCFPVVETVQGDLAGYIQTNLMSMTDGHIYFDIEMFSKGRRPAINPFLSVSRVGRQTQSSLKRSINREVISFLTLRERMEKFSHFGAEASANIKDILGTGDRILNFLDQESESVYHSNVQLFVFGILWFGYWNTKSMLEMKKDIRTIITAYITNQIFAAAVDDLLSKAVTLNDLLNTLAKDSGPLLASIGVSSKSFASATLPVQSSNQTITK